MEIRKITLAQILNIYRNFKNLFIEHNYLGDKTIKLPQRLTFSIYFKIIK